MDQLLAILGRFGRAPQVSKAGALFPAAAWAGMLPPSAGRACRRAACATPACCGRGRCRPAAALGPAWHPQQVWSRPPALPPTAAPPARPRPPPAPPPPTSDSFLQELGGLQATIGARMVPAASSQRPTLVCDVARFDVSYPVPTAAGAAAAAGVAVAEARCEVGLTSQSLRIRACWEASTHADCICMQGPAGTASHQHGWNEIAWFSRCLSCLPIPCSCPAHPPRRSVVRSSPAAARPVWAATSLHLWAAPAGSSAAPTWRPAASATTPAVPTMAAETATGQAAATGQATTTGETA